MDPTFGFRRNPPAPAAAIMQLLSEIGSALPAEYVEFLRQSNGGIGFVGETYAMLWRAEELFEFNRAYAVPEHAPTLLLIGSNGGGEGYAFDIA
jgi:hypothetical protein